MRPFCGSPALRGTPSIRNWLWNGSCGFVKMITPTNGLALSNLRKECDHDESGQIMKCTDSEDDSDLTKAQASSNQKHEVGPAPSISYVSVACSGYLLLHVCRQQTGLSKKHVQLDCHVVITHSIMITVSK